MSAALDRILAQPKLTHDLVQGSDEWAYFRLQHRGASEAAAVLGLSKNITRTELLRAKHTGIAREFSRFVQERILDKGHEVEALARPIIEQQLGEDLYPVTCSRGGLSASADGVTLDDDTIYEHKQWNDDLAGMVATGNVPDEHMPQCQQLLLVHGARRVLFVVSDGTPGRMVQAEVLPDRAWWERIAAGWEQFDADLAAFVPTEAPPKLVAEPVEALPAVMVQVSGSLTVADNFREFERRLRDFLDNRLIRTPKTDQDFADLDAQIKAMKQAREALKAAEAQMLAQVQPIDQAKRTKDMLDKLLMDNQRMAEKLLGDEKERRRGEIVAAGVQALREHIAKLNGRFPRPLMPTTATAVDFGGAIKNKRSLAAMEDAVAVTLANAKIAANDIADGIDANLKHLGQHPEHAGLFPDVDRLVTKAADDFAAVVAKRIGEHKALVQREAEAAAEAAREKIRKEEAERLQREQQRIQVNLNNLAVFGKWEKPLTLTALRERREALIAEPITVAVYGDRLNEADRVRAAALGTLDAEIAAAEEALARQQAQAATPAPAPAPAEIASPAPASQAPAPSPNVVQIPPRAAAPASPPTLKLGEISARLGFVVTADFIARMGFQPAGKQGAAVLFHEADFSRMCDSIVAHVRTVQQQQRAA